MTSLSKAMAVALRHAATKYGVRVTNDGWISATDVLDIIERTKKEEFPRSQSLLKMVVDTQEARGQKNRYESMEDHGILFLRAIQGHSMNQVKTKFIHQQITLEMIQNSDPSVPQHCVHGTQLNLKDSILRYGLIAGGPGGGRGKRNDIHFAPYVPQMPMRRRQVEQAGLRTGSTMSVHIDMPRAIQDGIEFYMTKDRIILSPGRPDHQDIPAKYILEIYDLCTAEKIYPRVHR